VIVGFTDMTEEEEKNKKIADVEFQLEGENSNSLVLVVLEEHLINNRCITDVKVTFSSKLSLVVTPPVFIYSLPLATHIV
jgi:hypothetical protein